MGLKFETILSKQPKLAHLLSFFKKPKGTILKCNQVLKVDRKAISC